MEELVYNIKNYLKYLNYILLDFRNIKLVPVRIKNNKRK